MKKSSQLFFCAFLIFLTTNLLATAKDSFEVLQNRNEETVIKFTIPQIEFTQIKEDGVTYTKMSNPVAGTMLDNAKPEMLTFSTYVKIPNNGGIDFSYELGKPSIINDIKVYPYQDEFLPNYGTRFDVDTESYNSSSAYPSSAIKISDPMVMRDHRVVLVSVCPFEYYASEDKLVKFEDVTLTIKANNSPSINEVEEVNVRSLGFNNFYRSNIINLPSTRDPNIESIQQRILVVYANSANEEFLEKLDYFVEWKRQKGFYVDVANTVDTGTSNTSIKSYIQNQYDNLETRPDFVILMGDADGGSFDIPAFTESVSNYSGAGDLPYSLLAGDDNLSDVFIGRISFDTVTEFKTIINKIVRYEKYENIYDNSWMNDVLLAGATAHGTGISAWITNRYIKEMYSWVYPETEFNVMEENATSPAAVNTALNEGKLFYNYRGWLGMDGWSDSYINSIANDDMPFNAVIVTCGTGPYANYGGEAKSELIVRQGTVATSKGALTAIGLSTSGTHTTFNNCLVGAIWHGLLIDGFNTMGEALAVGQSYLYEVYGNSHPDQAYYFGHWAALMGDPSMSVYKTQPEMLSASFSTALSSSSNHIEVEVKDSGNSPLPNAWVTITNSDQSFQASQFTGENGIVNIPLESNLTGELTVVVTKQDYITTIGSSIIGGVSNLNQNSTLIDDDNNDNSAGNADANINPGETVEYSINVFNSSGQSLNNLDFELTTLSEYVTITSSDYNLNNLANGTGGDIGPFVFEVNNDTPDQFIAEFKLSTDINGIETDFYMQEVIHAANLEINQLTVADGTNGILDPGEEVNISVTLLNNGSFNVDNLQAELVSLNDAAIITEANADFGSIPAGMSASNNLGTLRVNAMAILVPGMQLQFELHLTNEDGYSEIEPFMLEVGSPDITDPTGPDAHGYFIYDDGDTDFEEAPTYEWIEINSIGDIVPITDTGNNADDSEVVDLPFTFTFYGEEYNQITICSNGWISFGESTQATFRNWRIPGALGPNPFVAVFWDDLLKSGSSNIYTYYDSSLGAFIVEWDDMKNYYNTAVSETFQAILYNPLMHETSTGDGLIKLQYKDIANVDQGNSSSHGNYASIGLEDHSETIGVEYTFNNEYPTTAKPLENEMALLIAPQPVIHENAYLNISNVYVHKEIDGNFYPVIDNKLEVGQTYYLGVQVANLGLSEATNVNVSISSTDANVTIIENSSEYNDISSIAPQSNMSYFEITVAETCPDNRAIAFSTNIISAEGNWNRTFTLTTIKPTITYRSYAVIDNEGNNNNLLDINETVKIVVNVENPSLATATNVNGTLTTTSSDVTIPNTEISDVIILPGKTTQFVYEVSAGGSLSNNDVVTFDFELASTATPIQNTALSVTIGLANFSTNFDNDNGGYIGDWEWGNPSDVDAHSAPNVWATSLSGNYSQNTTKELQSSEYFIGPNAELAFWHKYAMENTYDGGCLKISTDNGTTWEAIIPEGGYTGNVYALGEDGWCGSADWNQTTFDLSSYANQNVVFKWKFSSDSMVHHRGWFIDDIELAGSAVEIGGVSGTITIPNELRDIENAAIFNNDLMVHPNAAGEYEMYLSAGSHDLSASMIGAESITTAGTTVINGYVTADVNFELNLLAQPTNLIVSSEESSNLVQLTWEYDQGSSPTLTEYRIYRQKNTSPFEQIGTTTETSYSETLDAGIYSYRVTAFYQNGESIPSNQDEVEIAGVSASEAPSIQTQLLGNYPNPFNPKTSISFSLKENANVKIKVFNVKGQLVKTLKNEFMSPGLHVVEWTGDNNNNRPVSTGVYFIKMKTGNYEQTTKALLLK